MLGCRSAQSEGPTSTSNESSTAPLADREPFELDFHVRGGQTMARVLGTQQAMIEIHQWETWLRVHSAKRAARMVLTRHNGDMVGRPIGLFGLALNDEQLISLRQSVESIAWDNIPAADPVELTADGLSLAYQRGSKHLRRDFNTSNRAILSALWPVMEQLNAWSAQALAHPMAALALTLRAQIDPANKRRCLLRLAIENSGKWPIVMADPRARSASDREQSRVRWMVAPAPSSTMVEPTPWSTIESALMVKDQADDITIAAGGKFEMSTPWQAPQPGAYVAQVQWYDYGGPLRPSPQHLPFMPLSSPSTPEPASSPYPVRGAAFSAYAALKIEA